MAHEIENMFSVKVTPWHGLGTVVVDAPSIADVLRLAGLDWTVSLQPMLSMNPATGELVESDLKAITRDSDGQVYGHVTGKKYVPFQNADKLEFFRPFHESGLCQFETAGSLHNGQKTWILARITSGEDEIVKGDSVRRYLLFSNSHDGKTGIRVGFCPIRVVCANTLAIAHNDAGSKLVRLFHSKKTKNALEAVQQTVNLANGEFEATAEQYRALSRMPVSKASIAEYVTQVFYNGAQAESDREKIARESLNTEITKLFEVGYGNTLPGVAGTRWALYNAATQQLSYNSCRTQENRLESLWFGNNSNLNKRALEVALKL